MQGQGCIALLATGALLAGAAAASEDGLANAIGAGTAGVELRYRYEFVDQESFDKDAHASTLRLRLNYETGTWASWSAFVEFDQVIELFADNFNSGAGTSSPARDVYPVVSDPDGPDLNQLFLQYAEADRWRARIGRQRIVLDDERFVGGVGWRQNEQTYDGLTFSYDGFSRAKLFYGYVANVNRIFGDKVAAGDDNENTHLFNADVGLSEHWSVTGYAYLIDSDDVPAASTSTIGARLKGAVPAGKHRFEVLGEYATQSDRANSPLDYAADYFRVEAALAGKNFSAGVGVETLGSDRGEGFRTPLATLHAFNGWADQFLATPDAGLADRYVKLAYRPAGWNLQLVYHDFAADAGNGDFGRELDASVGRTLGNRYGLLFKLALYEAGDAPRVDTTKAWFMVTAGF